MKLVAILAATLLLSSAYADEHFPTEDAASHDQIEETAMEPAPEETKARKAPGVKAAKAKKKVNKTKRTN